MMPEADDDLGGGDDEHEEHGRLPVDVAERARTARRSVRLTALSISSMHMNITSGLRRTSTPTAPMPNRTAARIR